MRAPLTRASKELESAQLQSAGVALIHKYAAKDSPWNLAAFPFFSSAYGAVLPVCGQRYDLISSSATQAGCSVPDGASYSYDAGEPDVEYQPARHLACRRPAHIEFRLRLPFCPKK